MRNLLLYSILIFPLLQACTAKKGAVPALSGAAATVDASQSTLEASSDIVADNVAISEIKVILKNKSGDPVEGVPPIVVSSGSGNTISACTVSDENGLSTCSLKSTVAEEKRISMTFPTAVTGPSIVFLPGAAAKLGFLVHPSGGVAGTSWSTQPVVEIEDQYGNRVSTSTDVVTVTLTAGSGNLSGTLTATAVQGLATFSGLSIELIGDDKVLTASAAGLVSGSSVPFPIAPASNSQMVIITQPGGGGAAVPWESQPVIEFRDQYGNRTNSTDEVTATLSTGSGPLNGTSKVAAVAGRASFSNLSISALGSGKILTFSAAGLTSVVSSPFAIIHGPASQLVFTSQPSGGSAGDIWSTQPAIEIRDSLGNLVSSGSEASANVALSVVGGGTILGTATVAASGGVATFSGLSMTSVGTKVLSASLGTLSQLSQSFNITVGAASKLAFLTQPGGGVSGAVWSQQPVVVIRDAYDNLVTTGTFNVSISLTAGTGGLTGGTTVVSTAGIAAFFNVGASAAGSNKVITASAAGLTSATSNVFTVTPAAPAALAFSTQPGGGASAVPWSTQPVVEIRDSSGNFIDTATNAVTLTLTTGTGNLSGTVTVPAVGGRAVFTNLSMDLVGTDKVLTATAVGLSSVSSNAFTITPGIPQSNSLVSASTSSLFADGTTTSTITVTLKDAYANPVAGKSVTLVSDRGGTDTISGSPATTNASGIATFTVKSSTVGVATLTATVTTDSITLTTTPSITFKSFEASIAESQWSLSPVSQVANGVATSTISVTIKNADGEVLPGKSVTLTSSRGVTDVISISPAITNASGVASFTIKSSTTGEPTLTISVPADSLTLTSSASMSFLSVAPYADWQARFANSSSSSMSQGVNIPATSVWKDLFNLGPNDGVLNNFSYNTTASGWMGSGSGAVSSGTTGAYRLGFDGTDDFVDFGLGLNSAFTDFSFESWFRANAHTAPGKVIFGNGDNSDTGFSLRQSWLGNGYLEFSLSGNKSYVGEVISDAPTAYYRTEEASGTVANATVGVNGTYSGSGITYAQTTNILSNSRTVRFNGTSGQITVGNYYNATNDFTVEVWVRPQAVAARKDFVNKEGTNNGWWLGMETTSKVSFAVGNGSAVQKVTSNTALLVNTWYHVVGVRDSSAGLLRIYINGVEEATASFTGSPSTNTSSLRIANSAFAGSRFFNGRIDEVAIYQNKALSAARISAHYGARSVATCFSTSAINSTAWQHIVGTYNDTTKVTILYVNGTAQCTLTATGAVYGGSSYSMAMGAQVAANGSALSETFWNGAIGDFRIYSSVLSAANVTTNRMATSGRFP